MRLPVILLLSGLLAAGCSETAPPPPLPKVVATQKKHVPVMEVPAETGIKEYLYEAYQTWQGTRYRIGGLSRRGIDCSGLMLQIFSGLGINLPRTTRDQVRVGLEVERDALEPGDLVFFRTGIFRRHVGVYLEDDIFLHASTSKGVMLSSLADPYWRKCYWTARRLRPLRLSTESSRP